LVHKWLKQTLAFGYSPPLFMMAFSYRYVILKNILGNKIFAAIWQIVEQLKHYYPQLERHCQLLMEAVEGKVPVCD
jgi:hypothetical protein